MASCNHCKAVVSPKLVNGGEGIDYLACPICSRRIVSSKSKIAFFILLSVMTIVGAHFFYSHISSGHLHLTFELVLLFIAYILGLYLSYSPSIKRIKSEKKRVYLTLTGIVLFFGSVYRLGVHINMVWHITS
jgi:hypothetical protein